MEGLHHDSVTHEAGQTLAAAKCLHHECSCIVTTGEHYCSDYCARAAGAEHSKSDHECACGHVDCTHSMATVPTVPLVAPQLS